jgi:hypothetical protein
MNLVPTVQMFPLVLIKRKSENIVTTNITNSRIQYPNNTLKAVNPITRAGIFSHDALSTKKKKERFFDLASVSASFVFPTNLLLVTLILSYQ